MRDYLIYIFYGDNSFTANEALDALIHQIGPKDTKDANVTSIDGQAFTIDSFGSAAMVPPFLADRRLVIIRNLSVNFEVKPRQSKRKSPAKNNNETSFINSLYNLLVEIPSTTDVVFLESKISSPNPLWEMFKGPLIKLGSPNERVIIKEFKSLKGEALSQWTKNRVEAKGSKISRAAIAQMIELVGEDLWSMENELEILSIYKHDQTIEIQDIEQMTSGSRDTNIFELVDRVIEGKTEQSIKLMNEMTAGESTSTYSPAYLIAMIARQVRLIALVHDLSTRGTPSSEWKAALGTSSDFVMRKTVQQSKAIIVNAVKHLYDLLVEADSKIKSSQNSETAILFDLIARASLTHKV